jgi:hypothetical protein
MRHSFAGLSSVFRRTGAVVDLPANATRSGAEQKAPPVPHNVL